MLEAVLGTPRRLASTPGPGHTGGLYELNFQYESDLSKALNFLVRFPYGYLSHLPA